MEALTYVSSGWSANSCTVSSNWLVVKHMEKQDLISAPSAPVEDEKLALVDSAAIGQEDGGDDCEEWEFGDATTYHIIPHPLNPGRKKPKRSEPTPGLSVLYQTTPPSKIPKEMHAAAKDPMPRFLRRLFRRPEPDWEKIEQAKRELDRLRGHTVGVYKPKRKGNPIKFWKKRPPKPKSRRICQGTRFELVDRGTVTNKSTCLENQYEIDIDGLGKMTLQHNIWKLRSPIFFTLEGVRLEWKGTRKIRHPSGKEKALWIMSLAHLKLVAFPQESDGSTMKEEDVNGGSKPTTEKGEDDEEEEEEEEGQKKAVVETKSKGMVIMKNSTSVANANLQQASKSQITIASSDYKKQEECV